MSSSDVTKAALRVKSLFAGYLRPIVAECAHEASYHFPSVVGLTSIFECLSSDLEEQSLLRVTSFDFLPGHGEERRVDLGEVILEEVSKPSFDGSSSSKRVIKAVNVVP